MCEAVLTPIVVDEIERAFDQRFGKSAGMTENYDSYLEAYLANTVLQEIPVADTVSALAHRVACRVLVCQELSQNDNFLQLSMKFQHSIFIHAMIMISLPFGPFREFFSWVIALSHRRNLGKAMAILQPVVARRIAERKENAGQKQIDGIQWTLDLTGDEDLDPYQVSLEILHNLFAGSLAPGAMITEMIFQALMDPNLLEDLRTEAQKALEECGWTDKLFQKLPLQDSFVRELNRVYPTGSSKHQSSIESQKYD